MIATAPRHAEIRIELELAAPVAAIFRAYADPELRRRWVRMPGPSGEADQRLDFRVGATETSTGLFPTDDGGERLELTTTHLDIVEPQRIVSASLFRLDDRPRWASLITVILSPAGSGTRLVRTEQLTVLEPTGDGERDIAHQRGGARLQLNGLVALLTGAAASSA